VSVDLGATAKAFGADRIAARAHAVTGTGVLVNLGGDIAVAGPPPEGGWIVRVADRHDSPDDAPGQVVALQAGGLATSGTAARRWRRGGRLLHHLVDPATGGPADTCWRTVTVTADTCVDANTASTAATIIGPAAPEWLAERGRPARLVDVEGRVVRVGGWPAAGDGES
jgi:thiamine biosynthesis lipoprotein